VAVPFLEKKQYADLHIVNGGQTFVMQMWDGVGFYLIAMDIMSGSVVPIYPDPLGVYVSGDGSVLMIAVEQGLALFSAKALAVPEIDQDTLLGSAAVWAPPESWAVTVNPRAEWMQMYNDAMRNMRDAFYDPDMHGVDWPRVTEMYRPLVYKISTKNELRDVLQQALGELSVLHVFVSIRSEVSHFTRRRALRLFGRVVDRETERVRGGVRLRHERGVSRAGFAVERNRRRLATGRRRHARGRRFSQRHRPTLEPRAVRQGGHAGVAGGGPEA
jgi:hypothetical protein